MKLRKLKAGLLIMAVGAFTVSCEKENLEVKSPEQQQFNQTKQLIEKAYLIDNKSSLPQIDENLGDLFIGKNAVEPTECGPTAFVDVQRKYIGPLGQDLIAIFGSVNTANIVLSNYRIFNQYHSLFDTSVQYFGVNGEYTDFMSKRKLGLEKFFNMPNQITVNGQHSATLNNRAELMKVFPLFFGSNAAANADFYLEINTLSPHIPESPLFASDGFATFYRGRNLIVIGDGIVTMLSETGIEPEIVWTGILAHEWAHQIQFFGSNNWYPNGVADNIPESTRYTELEADFIAAYYMTHKRGATYNWKRVEQFFTLFFQIGDCGFEKDGHHGTPAQRMEAARLGFELANDAQKQGSILSADELHEIFVEKIKTVIPAPSTTE